MRATRDCRASGSRGPLRSIAHGVCETPLATTSPLDLASRWVSGGLPSGRRSGCAGTMEAVAATHVHEPVLVPELLVRSLGESLDFWCRLCGFTVLYDRPDEGFAYISRGMAHVMLEQEGLGRNWVTAPLDRPLGRGVNLQVSVPTVKPLVEALRRADWPVFMEPETKWYRTGQTAAGVVQFLVQDPDGYLIRFQSSVGRRAADR